MIAEVLSIGTELLMGQTLNTNTRFLAQRLSTMGIAQYHQVTVGDNPRRLREAYETALQRSDIVITSGGLGPTGDDITKEMLAEALGRPLVAHEGAKAQILARFQAMHRPMAENNLRQAMFTENSILLENDNGTAPGAIVPCDPVFPGKVVIHLPGPPRELEPMFDLKVKPYLEARAGHAIVSRYIRIFGMGESDVDMRLKDLMAGSNPSLSPYCSLGEVQLRATASAPTEAEALALLLPLVDAVAERIGDVVYDVRATDDGAMEISAVQALSDNHLVVALCESLTGGMLADRIVNVPGASRVFAGGFVTYQADMKIRLADVPAEIIARHGVVSEACAEAMAKGTLIKTGADMALSLTGYAGPAQAGIAEEIGLVFIGVATKEGTKVKTLHLSGNRDRIRTLSALNALNMIRVIATGGLSNASL